MANYTTGSQRYNKRMGKIWDDYKAIKQKESKMSYKELIAEGYSKQTAKHIIDERKSYKKATSGKSIV